MPKKQFSITVVGFAIVVALVALSGSMTQATAGKLLNQTGCNRCCPECNHFCKLEVLESKEEKKCFEVKTEVICIPRVVFPWQHKSFRTARSSCEVCVGHGCSTCVHNGAKTRNVKILTSRKFKCPKCKYSWSAEERPCR